MSCAHWQIIRRPEYQADLDAIQAWVAKDNPLAALDLWLGIDTQVDGLSDPNFPRVSPMRMNWWPMKTTLFTLIRTPSVAPSLCAQWCMWPGSFRPLLKVKMAGNF